MSAWGAAWGLSFGLSWGRLSDPRPQQVVYASVSILTPALRWFVYTEEALQAALCVSFASDTLRPTLDERAVTRRRLFKAERPAEDSAPECATPPSQPYFQTKQACAFIALSQDRAFINPPVLDAWVFSADKPIYITRKPKRNAIKFTNDAISVFTKE